QRVTLQFSTSRSAATFHGPRGHGRDLAIVSSSESRAWLLFEHLPQSGDGFAALRDGCLDRARRGCVVIVGNHVDSICEIILCMPEAKDGPPDRVANIQIAEEVLGVCDHKVEASR